MAQEHGYAEAGNYWTHYSVLTDLVKQVCKLLYGNEACKLLYGMEAFKLLHGIEACKLL